MEDSRDHEGYVDEDNGDMFTGRDTGVGVLGILGDRFEKDEKDPDSDEEFVDEPEEGDEIEEEPGAYLGWKYRLARAEAECRKAVAAGDDDGIRRWRLEIMQALRVKVESSEETNMNMEEDGEGTSTECEDEKPSVVEQEEAVQVPPPVKRKLKKVDTGGGGGDGDGDQLTSVPAGDVECKSVRKNILGYTGETYRDRRVVLFIKDPELFGGTPLKRAATVRLTLHMGILNHMEVGNMEEAPTAYWAVMDAASDMKSGFTTEQVLSRAIAEEVLYIRGRNCNDDDLKLKACRTAWYVLKSHQTHPKESYRGMSYIVDEHRGDGGKVLNVRARRPEEDVKYFESRRKKKSSSSGGTARSDVPNTDDVPLVSHVVSEVR